MNLVINQTSKVEFGISIAGTQTKPSEVRVVLGDGAKLVFKALTQDGINYSALVTPIKEVVGSICRLTIEVLFGDKIFVPINRMISIADTEPTEVCPAPEVIASPEYVPPPVETVVHTLPPEETTIPPEVEPKHTIEIPTKINIEEPEKEEEPVQLKKNAPIEIVKVQETVKPLGIIPGLFFKLVATPKEPEIITEKVITKPIVPPKKVQRKPLPKLNDKKPLGVELDTIKVTKSIFTEEVKKSTPKVSTIVKKAVPVIIEQETPIYIKREEILYL